MKMLRYSLGVTKLNKIRSEYIRGTAHARRLRDKLREERLRWYGHMMRRKEEYIGKRMLRIELPGRRKRGRPKRRFMDVVKEDMRVAGVTNDIVWGRLEWRRKIRCGDP